MRRTGSLGEGSSMNYSYQRQVVFETLRSQKDHLTALQIYQLARKTCPRLSLGTVYRNLNMLVEFNQVGRVCVPGEADRFDWQARPHQHFYCRACEQVQNLELPLDALEEALHGCADVKVDGYALIVTGLCADCRDKE